MCHTQVKTMQLISVNAVYRSNKHVAPLIIAQQSFRTHRFLFSSQSQCNRPNACMELCNTEWVLHSYAFMSTAPAAFDVMKARQKPQYSNIHG